MTRDRGGNEPAGWRGGGRKRVRGGFRRVAEKIFTRRLRAVTAAIAVRTNAVRKGRVDFSSAPLRVKIIFGMIPLSADRGVGGEQE